MKLSHFASPKAASDSKPDRAPALFLLFLGGALAGSHQAQDASIYYDGIASDGSLVGGRVNVSPTDPLNIDTQTAQERTAAVLALGTSTNVVTLLDNGPADRRIDLVLVGDGYTAGEIPAFAADCDAVVAGVFAEFPFDEYMSFFNVHRVDVISNESGVDNDPTQGIQRDTALGMQYWCGGTQRLLCVNVGAALNAAALAPGRDSTLALANSTKYGGAGYTSSNLATVAGHNGAAIEIALHELGHSFGLLADEYTYGGPTAYTGSEPSRPNVSIHQSTEMALLQTKWHQWLGTVGADTFEGASYSETGIYRPTNNSLMRNLGRPFDAVNVEQLIVRVYAAVDPIDAATSSGSYGPNATFFVTPMQPLTHTLDTQWSLDGAPIAGATGTTFDASTLGLGSGNFVLSARVVDNTPLVTNEALRTAYLSETRTWTLTSGGYVTEITGCGFNPANSCTAFGVPAPGNTMIFDVRNPTGQQPAGSLGVLALSSQLLTSPSSESSCGPLLFGFSMNTNPSLPGELLVGIDAAHLLGLQFGAPTTSAGGGSLITVPVPNVPSLIGVELFAQAAVLTATATGPQIGLGRGQQIRFGN